MVRSKRSKTIIEGERYEKKLFNITSKSAKAGLVILYYIIYSIAIYIPFIVFNIDLDSIPDTLYYVYYFATEIILVISLIYIYMEDFKRYWRDFKANGIQHLKKSFNYWFIGVSIMIVSNILIGTFSPISIPENEQAVRETLKASPVLIVFATVFQAPIIEEILFRKIPFDLIKNKKLYIIVSGLIFGSFHIIGAGTTLASWLYVIPYSALGMAFAYTLVKTNNLLSTISIHSFHNFITVVQVLLLM